MFKPSGRRAHKICLKWQTDDGFDLGGGQCHAKPVVDLRILGSFATRIKRLVPCLGKLGANLAAEIANDASLFLAMRCLGWRQPAYRDAPGLSRPMRGLVLFQRNDAVGPVDVGNCDPAKFARSGAVLPQGRIDEPKLSRGLCPG